MYSKTVIEACSRQQASSLINEGASDKLATSIMQRKRGGSILLAFFVRNRDDVEVRTLDVVDVAAEVVAEASL